MTKHPGVISTSDKVTPESRPNGGGTDQDPKSEPSPSGNPPEEKRPLQELFALDANVATDDQIQGIVGRHMSFTVGGIDILSKYNVMFLHDTSSIDRSDANRVYSSVSVADSTKPILLILHSPGGDISAAYFIAKLCREYTHLSFEVVVPRQAKSAATLVCCAADRIHMGSLSELGPIDPQFGAIPALALKYSVEHIAQLAAQYPGASQMFSDYLSKTLRVEALGFYERVAESATQYAVRLLNSRPNAPTPPDENDDIAKRLVYAYKDHGFAIDVAEATDIFGPKVVVRNTDEYNAGNQLYGTLDFLRWYLRTTFKRDLSFVGHAKDGCWVLSIPDSAS